MRKYRKPDTNSGAYTVGKEESRLFFRKKEQILNAITFKNESKINTTTKRI